jgi:V/A-type H+-transporting ATPase subunit E
MKDEIRPSNWAQNSLTNTFMAINDILEEIKRQAEQEVAQLDAERDDMIAKITSEYNDKRTNRKEEMEAKVADNAAKVKSRAETFAKMEIRNNMLRAKRDILQDVFGKTVDSLVKSDKYVDIVVALLKQAAGEFNEGTVMGAEGKDAQTKKALEKAGSKFKLSKKSADIQGGFILEAGQVEVNFSFEAILGKELWNNIELELNKLLFP